MVFSNDMKVSDSAPSPQQWFARLELGFERQSNRTIMKHRKHFGPIRVQKMLWPEKTGVCHAIVVHPPAGIAGGDHLSFDVRVHQDAHALVTTPGAGKWYRSNNKPAFQHLDLMVGDAAVLEWLPQETMLFDAAYAHSSTTVQLSQNASFIGWDMLVIGRQARLENFSQGSYRNHFQLYRAEQLLVSDCLSFQGQDRFLHSCLGMDGHAVMGSFWAVAPEQYRGSAVLDALLAVLRELMVRMKAQVTLTRLDDVLCARYLGDDVRACHDAFAAIRARLRSDWYGLDEEFPRIWRT